MAASAAIVYSGNQGGRADNSGSAPILDTAGDFLPYVMQINARREAERTAEATRAREAAKASEKAWASFEIDMPDVWAADSPYVEQDLVKYHDSLVEEKLKGGDPLDTYSDSGKLRKQNETQIKKRTSLAKDNETYFNQNKEAIAKDAAGKYDKKYAAEWFTKYADPKLTPEDRAKMRLDSSPYKLNYSELAFIDETLPDPTQEGRKKSINKAAHLANMAAAITSPEGQEKYNTLKKEGEDEITFMERMAQQAQKMHPPDYGPEPQASQSSGSNKRYSTTGSQLDLEAVPVHIAGFGGEKTKSNGITFNQVGQNMKPISVFDEEGNSYELVGQFTVQPAGGATTNAEGKAVVGKLGKRGEGFVVSGTVKDPDGGVEQREFWMSSQPGTNGYENYQSLSSRTEKPIDQYIGASIGGGKSGGTKYVGLDANGDPIFE